MFSGQIQCMFLETAWGIKSQLAGQNTGKQHFSLNSSVLIWERKVVRSLKCHPPTPEHRAESPLAGALCTSTKYAMFLCLSSEVISNIEHLSLLSTSLSLFSGKFFRARGSIMCTRVVGSPWPAAGHPPQLLSHSPSSGTESRG